jgi:peptidylglycine monooxygenase
MFYNVTYSNLKIKQDDLLIAQCIMDSTLRNQTTAIGPRNEDEMCNFYIMYYTSYPGLIQNTLCFKDAQEFTWKESLKLEKTPINADNLDGVNLLRPEMTDME